MQLSSSGDWWGWLSPSSTTIGQPHTALVEFVPLSSSPEDCTGCSFASKCWWQQAFLFCSYTKWSLMYFHSMLEYKHQFECLLALCWINPVLDLEAFPQASHGEGTFPMGLFSMWYYLIISYLIITFPMCLFLMCTLWHYIFLLFHTLYKPGLCPLLPLAFLRHHQILTRAFIPMWNKKYQTYFLHLINYITW